MTNLRALTQQTTSSLFGQGTRADFRAAIKAKDYHPADLPEGQISCAIQRRRACSSTGWSRREGTTLMFAWGSRQDAGGDQPSGESTGFGLHGRKRYLPKAGASLARFN
jgi:hypothetical protein